MGYRSLAYQVKAYLQVRGDQHAFARRGCQDQEAEKQSRANTVSKSQLEYDLMALIHEAGLPQPQYGARILSNKRQHVDLAWLPQRIAVEVQGGIWQKSGHTTGNGLMRDYKKVNELQLMGWRVFLFSAEMIYNGEAINTIAEALRWKIKVLAVP
jgi:hypothetical protein